MKNRKAAGKIAALLAITVVSGYLSTGTDYVSVMAQNNRTILAEVKADTPQIFIGNGKKQKVIYEENTEGINLSEYGKRINALITAAIYPDLDKKAVISKEVAALSKEGFDLKEGDIISLKDLLTIYLYTDAQDARAALMENIPEMELSDTKIDTKTFLNRALIFFKTPLIKQLLGLKRVTVEYQDSIGTTYTRGVKNENQTSYSKVDLPKQYTLLARIAGNSESTQYQICYFKDKDKIEYISFAGQVPLDLDISKETAAAVFMATETEPEVTPTPSAVPTPKPTKIPTPEPTKMPTPEEPVSPEISNKAKLPVESNNARYNYITGTDYYPFTIYNAPAGYRSDSEAKKNMVTISVPVWKMHSDGKKYPSQWILTINKKLEKSVRMIYDEIFALDIKFPIKCMKGYGYRKVGGVGLTKSTLLSIHSFGAAIDINFGDYDNDYYLGKGNDLRNKNNPYCIPDEVIAIFKDYGWFWGGEYEICSDTMHFQYLGLNHLSYQGKNVFPTLGDGKTTVSRTIIANLQERLRRLGYTILITETYDKATKEAIIEFQNDHNIEATGIMDYKTWETIINLTHDMSYAF